MRILNESLKNNDRTILLLGSSNIINENNPFTLIERRGHIYNLY
jgi:hypothetical protein